MGTIDDIADKIFQEIHGRRTCEQNGRYGRCQRLNQRRFCRNGLRLYIFILVSVPDVLLQFEIDCGGYRGLDSLFDFHFFRLSSSN